MFLVGTRKPENKMVIVEPVPPNRKPIPIFISISQFLQEIRSYNLLTVIQSRHIVRKHAQQIAKADSRQDQDEPEEEEFARFNL
jgi:hypothetical protein